MSNTGISLASLVKNNNGLYKSDKQAKFLLATAEDGVHIVMVSLGRSSYTLFYHLDSKGVVKVEKYLPSKAKSTVTWERKEEGKLTAQEQKEIRRITREISSLEKMIAGRQEACKRGEYAGPGMIDVYHNRMREDQDLLAAYKVRLTAMK